MIPGSCEASQERGEFALVPDSDFPEPQRSDEAYFDPPARGREGFFDARLLRQRLTVLPNRSPLIFGPEDFVAGAMRAMQDQHRGCVLVSSDGTPGGQLAGIFTERDVLNKIIGQGRNPALVKLSEVMIADPEALPQDASVAWVLNKMSVGGFRHVPVVDGQGRIAFVVSVRDVVQFLVEAFPNEVLNLPPEFGALHKPQRDGA